MNNNNKQNYPQQNTNNTYPQQNNNQNFHQQYPQQQHGQQGHNNYPNSNQNPYYNGQPNQYPQQGMQNQYQQNQYNNQGYGFQPYGLAQNIIMMYADQVFMKHDQNRSGFIDVKEIYPAVQEIFISNNMGPPQYQHVLSKWAS